MVAATVTVIVTVTTRVAAAIAIMVLEGLLLLLLTLGPHKLIRVLLMEDGTTLCVFIMLQSIVTVN